MSKLKGGREKRVKVGLYLLHFVKLDGDHRLVVSLAIAVSDVTLFFSF